jgi:hypothetical protein
MTHTYAILNVSPEAYREIREKLEAAGYDGQFHDRENGEVIDMHGIALQQHPGRCPICTATLCKCSECNATWCLDHQPNPLVCPNCGARPHDRARKEAAARAVQFPREAREEE